MNSYKHPVIFRPLPHQAWKRLIFSAFCLLTVLLCLWSSAQASWSSMDRKLVVSGSTTLLPLIQKTSGMYSVMHPEISFSFQATGSLIGQAQAASGAAHMAVSDLPLVHDYQTYPLLEIPFVRLPVFLAAHITGLKNLTSAQVKGIFSGRYQNWQELGGPDLPIIVVLRSGFSGIMQVIQDWLGQPPAPHLPVRVSSNAEAMDYVEANPGAISAVGGMPPGPGAEVLSIDSCLPGGNNSSGCSYPLFTDSRLLIKEPVSPAAAEFITFLLAPEVMDRILSDTLFQPLPHELPQEVVKAAARYEPSASRKRQGWELSARILAGIALFLVGIRFISTSLKKVAGRRIRKLFARWSENIGLGALWGILSGAVAQSSSSAAFVLTGMVSSGVMGLKNALYILSWAEIGTTLLVFLATWNIHLAILYFLSVSGFLYAMDRKGKNQQVLLAMFGLGLVLFGFDMIKSTSTDLAQSLWVQNLMELGTEIPVLLFGLGALLRILTQSSSTVALLCIPVAHAGILDLNQVLLTFFGAAAGSGMTGLIMSGNAAGTPRQVTLVKSSADFISSLGLLMLLLLGSLWTDNAADHIFRFMGRTIEEKAAWAFLLVKAAPGATMFILAAPLRSLAEKISPPTRVESLARLRFVQENALQDPATALQMTARESDRIITRLPSYLQPLRREEGHLQVHGRLDELHQAARELNHSINEIFTELFGQDMRRQEAELLIQTQNQHRILESLEEQLYELTCLLGQDMKNQNMEKIRHLTVEGLYTILTIAGETVENPDPAEWDLLLSMTGDRSGVVAELRKSYLNKEQDITPEARSLFLHMTNVYQRTVWLIHSWAESRLELIKAGSSGRK